MDSMPDPQTHTFTLPSGRSLSYLTLGSPLPSARPLLYLHGSPGSPHESLFLATAAATLNMRIVAPARPGTSASTADPTRTVLSYSADVARLLDHLGTRSVDVLAVSAGSPYALALAHAPHTSRRVRTVTLVAGVGPPGLGTAGMSPPNRVLCFLLRWRPSLVLRWVRSCGAARAAAAAERPCPADYAAEFLDRLRLSRAAGREFWEDGRLVRVLRRAVEEAFEQGPEEMVLDAGLGARDWGFRVQDVRTVRPVRLWYSEADENVPLRIGRGLERMLGNARLRTFEGDGHIDICVRRAEEILRGVLEI